MTNRPSPRSTLLCQRNAGGRIDALTRQPLSASEMRDGGWQVVSPSDSDVNEFMLDVSNQSSVLSHTDIGLARVLEDLIDTLISRGVIQFTDLPQAAQGKLLERRETRAHLPGRLQLLSSDDDQGLF
jgi:hypothetical protein